MEICIYTYYIYSYRTTILTVRNTKLRFQLHSNNYNSPVEKIVQNRSKNYFHSYRDTIINLKNSKYVYIHITYIRTELQLLFRLLKIRDYVSNCIRTIRILRWRKYKIYIYIILLFKIEVKIIFISTELQLLTSKIRNMYITHIRTELLSWLLEIRNYVSNCIRF